MGAGLWIKNLNSSEKLQKILLLLTILFLLAGLVTVFVRNLGLSEQLILKNEMIKNSVDEELDDLSEDEVLSYLTRSFPEADKFERYVNNQALYLALKGDEKIGFAKIIYKYIPCSQCLDIKFVCCCTMDGKIRNITLINKISLYGEKIEA